MNDLQDSWEADKKNETARKRKPRCEWWTKPHDMVHLPGGDESTRAQHYGSYKLKRKKKKPYCPGSWKVGKIAKEEQDHEHRKRCRRTGR